jgi:hypothetical protein
MRHYHKRSHELRPWLVTIEANHGLKHVEHKVVVYTNSKSRAIREAVKDLRMARPSYLLRITKARAEVIE